MPVDRRKSSYLLRPNIKSRKISTAQRSPITSNAPAIEQAMPSKLLDRINLLSPVALIMRVTSVTLIIIVTSVSSSIDLCIERGTRAPMPTEDERLIFDQSRTVSQASPRMAKMSGREVIEAIRAGLLAPPPLARLIGFQIAAIADGQVEFALEPREDLENLAGALHGGVAASLLDNALGAAVQSLLPAGARSATLNLNVSYLRGLTVRSGVTGMRPPPRDRAIDLRYSLA